MYGVVLNGTEYLHPSTAISMLVTPLQGTFTRNGSIIQIYFTDATSAGVVNFVIWDADVLSKKVAVKYWEVKSAN